MIYCNLKGGLGNILFQVAATFEFSKKLNVECSFPNLHEHLVFLQKENYCNSNLKDITHYKELFGSLKTIYPPSHIQKVAFPFHYVEKQIPRECIIDGFFQSEKYFKNSRQEMLSLFKKNKTIDKVSVHVRRGDYLEKQRHHNILSKEYYLKAFKVFPNQKILMFSDDIEWCKKTFIGQEIEFFKGKTDIEDLKMMSSCHSNIIANSSFSWWAAWLNTNQNKKVVCPSQWVGESLSHLNTSDIHCADWIKIKG